MIIMLNDEQAASLVTEAAFHYPEMNNDEVYEYLHEWMKQPVSRRQVANTMKAIRKAKKASLTLTKGELMG